MFQSNGFFLVGGRISFEQFFLVLCLRELCTNPKGRQLELSTDAFILVRIKNASVLSGAASSLTPSPAEF